MTVMSNFKDGSPSGPGDRLNPGDILVQVTLNTCDLSHMDQYVIHGTNWVTIYIENLH